MKKKAKAIIALIVLGAMLLGLVGGCGILNHQPKATVTDRTSGQGTGENSGDGSEKKTDGSVTDSSGTGAAQVTLSSSVTVFDEDAATRINGAIRQVRSTDGGLILRVDSGTALEELGIGDIFFLDGGSDTPLGETYIGKIVGMDPTSGTYLIETPMVDEVFDVLEFRLEEVLTPGSITSIDTAPGVTASHVDDLSSHFTQLRAQEGPQVVPLGKSGSEDGIIFECELDLLDMLGLKEEKDDIFEEYSGAEGDQVTVYRTATGECYHRGTCPSVGRSKFELTLREAIDEAFTPCHLCLPPVLDGFYSEELTLTGSLGFRSITCDVDFDWNVDSGFGVETLKIAASGDFTAGLELKSSMQLEIGGKTTERTLPIGDVKLQGLKEKLIPIAFVQCGTGVTVSGNQGIRTLTGTVPMTLGFLIYVDIQGNVGVEATASINFEHDFSCRMDIVRDGQWVWETEYGKDEPQTFVKLESLIQADLDACVGASVSVYIFNVNVVELAVIKFGTEVQGTLGLKWNSKEPTDITDALVASFYQRIYMKLFELNIKIKAKASVWVADLQASFEYDLTLRDITLAEWGTLSSTRYDPATMDYTAVAAKDAEAVYYKDTTGKLIREQGRYKTTLFSDDFFSICGIDQTYLYLMIPNGTGSYDIHRVNKENGLSKSVVSGVDICLMNDAQDLYYVSDFDEETICVYHREREDTKTFYSLDGRVISLEPHFEGLYAVTSDNDAFSWVFGASCNYLILSSTGPVLRDLGSSPKVPDYALADLGSFYVAMKRTDHGYLRSVASNVYWLSKDRTRYAEATGISGWNYAKDVGIFTTKYSTTGVTDYEILLWSDDSGNATHFADVSHEAAFFTICHSSLDDWYYFDQEDGALVLYRLSPDLSHSEVVTTLTQSGCDLSECGMVILDDRIYFYTMPDQWTSQVLYRYDIA